MASPIFICDFSSASTLLRSSSGSTSGFSAAFLRASMSLWMASTSSLPSLSLCSIRFFSVWYRDVSARFFSSTRSLRVASSAACRSASRTICSMSASERPPDERIWMRCSLPVPLSLAETLTIPFASMSKVTSICGIPRGEGGMPTRSNWPSILLSAAISRSPCITLMPTCVWLSAAVEKVCDFLVGIVVLRGISLVITPPSVSMPRESGVTSSRRISFTSPRSTPPWIAAPIATTSSGFTPLYASRPKNLETTSCTRGMRVMPPTRMTSLTSLALTPASLRQFLHGGIVRSTRSSVRLSSLARVILRLKCFGPDWSAVMNGRLMSVCVVDESSTFAFSPASRRRWRASESLERSSPCSFLNSSTRNLVSRLSKSSPPRCVSPLVALTSNTPPEISSTETSNVPPPRSYTVMTLLSPLSMP
mmetsp:Transcript_9827/g.25403  ORF Transcript_9827/g.25403 Transcript_9827/m.25403 type:complete len:421 (+) Transcript_9827:150-1412(+)